VVKGATEALVLAVVRDMLTRPPKKKPRGDRDEDSDSDESGSRMVEEEDSEEEERRGVSEEEEEWGQNEEEGDEEEQRDDAVTFEEVYGVEWEAVRWFCLNELGKSNPGATATVAGILEAGHSRKRTEENIASFLAAYEVDADFFHKAVGRYRALEQKEVEEQLAAVEEYQLLQRVAQRHESQENFEDINRLQSGAKVAVTERGCCVWGECTTVREHPTDGVEFRLKVAPECWKLISIVKQKVKSFKGRWSTGPKIWWQASAFHIAAWVEGEEEEEEVEEEEEGDEKDGNEARPVSEKKRKPPEKSSVDNMVCENSDLQAAVALSQRDSRAKRHKRRQT
jgi:hypothetical protein